MSACSLSGGLSEPTSTSAYPPQVLASQGPPAGHIRNFFERWDFWPYGLVCAPAQREPLIRADTGDGAPLAERTPVGPFNSLVVGLYTQYLPFFDPGALELVGRSERALYGTVGPVPDE